jgi:pyrophosphatase PpaX
MGKTFDWIITLDEVKKPKPDPDGIRQCLDQFQLKSHDILFVGDTIYDYQAGKNAGVDTALVTWSLRKFDASIQPTFWIDDYARFFEIISTK